MNVLQCLDRNVYVIEYIISEYSSHQEQLLQMLSMKDKNGMTVLQSVIDPFRYRQTELAKIIIEAQEKATCDVLKTAQEQEAKIKKLQLQLDSVGNELFIVKPCVDNGDIQ